jgi:cytochrome P450
MAGDLVGWGNGLILLPYGEDFRQTRKLMHKVIGPRPAQEFWPLEEQETARFASRLLETPGQFLDHVRQ